MGYCCAYARWQALEETAAGQPFLVSCARHGTLIANPVFSMANKALALVLKVASELGLTPTSRARVSVQPGSRALEPLDGFALFQAQRASLDRKPRRRVVDNPPDGAAS
jgi:P27 family predicted phage terminase small subunit